MPNPNSKICMMNRVDTGAAVLAYNPSSTARNPLSLAQSTDGITWDPFSVLANNASVGESCLLCGLRYDCNHSVACRSDADAGGVTGVHRVLGQHVQWHHAGHCRSAVTIALKPTVDSLACTVRSSHICSV